MPALGEGLISAARIPHREHGTRRIPDDALGDAAEHRVEAADAPMRADDDEVVPAVARGLDDRAHGVAGRGSRRRASTEARPGSIDRVLERALEVAPLAGEARAHRPELVLRVDVEDLDPGVAILGERDRVIERREGWGGSIDRYENRLKRKHAERNCKRCTCPDAITPSRASGDGYTSCATRCVWFIDPARGRVRLRVSLDERARVHGVTGPHEDRRLDRLPPRKEEESGSAPPGPAS